jgi:dUTP pyrophosphatase
MEIKVKKLNKEAKLPFKATDGSAGFDLFAVTEKVRMELTGPVVEYDTGLSFEVPKGHVGLLFPRSSVTTKTTLMLGCSIGVLDSDFRGSVKFQFRQVNPAARKIYNVGDRIGQIVVLPIPTLNFVEVDELSDTIRGESGFGSTGE